MQADFVQDGTAVDYTPAGDVAAGDVVVQGDLVGITKRDITAGQLGALAVQGVFDVVKDAGVTIAAGAKVYWDATNSFAVTTASGNKLMGKCVLAAASAETSVRVRLNQ